ncbi:Protein-N(pi)-phosphohistidine--sugarphosphotran sferase [Coriobacterium glomerans PW2]|uniref:Protein-N(Pi)-phosphohistidine--sugarphosphotran sferase n=1 Tax=Coriobacterium glomerans (strain ATCC 49209 / DSM 20642 / JCM 10262 / PW2) TaxID=700015 RepID=F2NAA1_CORGP|nr:PTS transporter subunit EIIC [Coriobacterium glomerans]AEB06287.1 Protein-N(pi)-phosphohistidine--sugarphosphotran sferase [Coriobacterium glomerans PW2]
MNTRETALCILREIGGKDNIKSLTHCVTRLRFSLNSFAPASEARVKQIPGVLGVVRQGGQFQVIIGQSVEVVYNEIINDIPDLSPSAQEVDHRRNPTQGGIINKALDTIAGIFTPIMPVVAGSGMIKALLSILVLAKLIDLDGRTYYFLNFIADAGYYFLPIYLAASAARKFRCNMYMAMFLGGILLHPSFSALGKSGDFISVLNLPVRVVTYSSSVIPIVMIVFTYSFVEQFLEKRLPSAIKFIAKPLCSLMIMAPLSFLVLGPLGSFLGDVIVGGLLAIQQIAPWILPMVIGAFMPFLVMTGMHYSLLPAYVSSLSSLGYETVIGPGNLPSNIAQGAACLCVSLKSRNREFKQLSITSGISALLGITEPALFGVNLRLKKPLIAIAIGGGMGGLYAGITGVMRFGGGGAGLAALGLYVGENPLNILNALVSCVIAFLVTFLLTWFIGFDDISTEVSDEGSKTAVAS